MKNIVLEDDFVSLYIWDTAGQERYRSLVSTYFKNTNGICLIFDLTNRASFDSIVSNWYTLCKD